MEFTERNRRELHRPAARLPDATLDRLGEIPEVNVAMIELAPGLGDADDWLGQINVVEAGGFAPGAPRQAPVTRVTDTAGTPGEGIGHKKPLAKTQRRKGRESGQSVGDA